MSEGITVLNGVRQNQRNVNEQLPNQRELQVVG